MRISLVICLIMFGAGCAHSPQKAPEPASDTRALELASQAEKSYSALDFPACVDQFQKAAEATTIEDSRVESLYSAARCAAQANDAAKAMELLKRAVQSGYYDPDTLQYDPDLASLHSVAGWQEVLDGAKANLAKAPEPPLPVGVLSGVDVYGSRRADAESVRKLLGFEVGKPVVPSKAVFRRKENELKEKYNLAFVRVGFTYFFASERAGQAFITVDMVDAEDAQRVRFLPTPSGHPEDPEGLVAQWQTYLTKAEQLLRKGQLDMSNGTTCRVAHCVYGFNHPELAPYEPVFLEKVPKAQDALVKVLREEADADKRVATAYLLAYAGSPEQTVRLLVPFIRDPSGGVRNSVLRVLTATQEAADHPLVDLAVILDAATLPETTDRNKSIFLFSMLLEDMKPEELKAQKASIIRQLGPQLVTMANMAQPINQEPAMKVLQLLSGEKYETGEQWKAWLARQPK